MLLGTFDEFESSPTIRRKLIQCFTAFAAVTIINAAAAFTILSGLWHSRSLLHQTAQHTKLWMNTMLMLVIMLLCICAAVCAGYQDYTRLNVSALEYIGCKWIFEAWWDVLYAVFLMAIITTLLSKEENEPEAVDTTDTSISIPIPQEN